MKNSITKRILGFMLVVSIVVTQAEIANAAESEDYLLSEEFSEEVSEESSDNELSEEELLTEEAAKEGSSEEEELLKEEELFEEDLLEEETAAEASSVEESADDEASFDVSTQGDVSDNDVSGNTETEENTDDAEFLSGVGKVKWTLDGNGTLTLSGTGDLPDQTYGETPWESQKYFIRKVVVTGSVTAIGGFAFYGCTNLREVVLGNSVTRIGQNAFSGTAITSITFPAGFREYKSFAFSKCKSLTRVEFKGTKLTSCGAYAFEGCPINNVVFPAGIKRIPDYLFHGANFSGLNLTIPKTVTVIGKSSFEAEDGRIASLVFADKSSLTEIGSRAFVNCHIPKVAIPATVKVIRGEAFRYCSLSEITIPANVTNIGSWAFANNSSLTKVIIKSKKIKSDNPYIFERCAIREVVYPSGITTIPAMLFWGAGFSSSSVTIPKTVKTISRGAFYGTDIAEVKFEAGSVLQSIGQNAFSATQLSSINFPGSLKTIGSYSFQGTKLSTVVIPSKVKTIGGGAFSRCPYLTKVVLPKSLKSIGYDAFSTSILDSNTIRILVMTGSYAYKWVKKYASSCNYELVQCGAVSYVLKGGKNNSQNPRIYEKGQSIRLAAPTRTGYRFVGWFINKKCTRSADQANTSKGGNIKFYAKWEAETYTVAYNANGGTLVGDKSFTVKYGSKYPKLTSKATKTGYKFTGWYTQPQGGKKVTTSKVFKPANPVGAMVYAHYTPVKYKITYKLEGGKMKKKAPKTYTTNKNWVIPNPTRKGYTFAGWDVVKTTGKIAVSGGTIKAGAGNYGNVTLRAVWRPVK